MIRQVIDDDSNTLGVLIYHPRIKFHSCVNLTGVIMQPIAQGSAAASRIETNERQLFNDLKTLNKSVAAYNKQVSEISGPDQFKSLERLRLDSPPELTFITAIGKRKLEIIGLNVSMVPQSPGIGLGRCIATT